MILFFVLAGASFKIASLDLIGMIGIGYIALRVWPGLPVAGSGVGWLAAAVFIAPGWERRWCRRPAWRSAWR